MFQHCETNEQICVGVAAQLAYVRADRAVVDTLRRAVQLGLVDVDADDGESEHCFLLRCDVRTLPTTHVVDNLARPQIRGNNLLGEIGVIVDGQIGRQLSFCRVGQANLGIK